MARAGQLQPKESIQANVWPWLIPRIKMTGFICLGAAIKVIWDSDIRGKFAGNVHYNSNSSRSTTRHTYCCSSAWMRGREAVDLPVKFYCYIQSFMMDCLMIILHHVWWTSFGLYIGIHPRISVFKKEEDKGAGRQREWKSFFFCRIFTQYAEIVFEDPIICQERLTIIR